MQESAATPDRSASAADPRRVALNALSDLTVEEFGQVLQRVVRDDNSIPLIQELVGAATTAVSEIDGLTHRMHNGQAHLLVQQLGELLAAGHAGVVAVTAEALDRGEIAASQKGSTTAWVRDHCRYLRSGGAGIAGKAAGLLRRPELRRLADRIRSTELHPTIGVAIASEFDKLVGSLDESYLERMGLPAAPVDDDGTADSTDGADTTDGDQADTARVGDSRDSDRDGWTVGDVVLEKFCKIGKSGGTRDVKNLRDHLLAQYGGEGAFQDDAETKRKYLELSAGRLVSGIWHYDLALDPEGRAELEAAINVLAKPFPQNPETGEIDLRSQPQRRGQALVEVFRRATAAARDLPANPKAFVHVTVTLDDLINGTGSGTVIGTTADSTPLPIDTIRKLACCAGIIPTVMGSDGEVLDLGRPVRYFTRAQARALWIRDKHCTFPGCDVPATWCDNHHLVHVADGGGTDLVNGALLCGRHHTIVHRDKLHGVVIKGKVVWDLRPNSYSEALRSASDVDASAASKDDGSVPGNVDGGPQSVGDTRRTCAGSNTAHSSTDANNSATLDAEAAQAHEESAGVGADDTGDTATPAGCHQADGHSADCPAEGGNEGQHCFDNNGDPGHIRTDTDTDTRINHGHRGSGEAMPQAPARHPVVAPQRGPELRTRERTKQPRSASDPQQPPSTRSTPPPPERPGRSPISRT